jgi:Ca2+-binding EF-hand superfamily protein
VREKLQKEKEDRLLRYQLKWKEMRSLNKVLRASRAPNGEDIDNYNDSLQKTAAENPEPTCLSREQFCKIMLNSMGQHQLINAKHCNRVFSAFDPKRRDRLDIRELIGTLRLMRKPDQPARAKLAELFELFDIEARGYLTLAEIRVIALMGISSDEDKERLVREFNFSFQDYLKKGSDMQDISLADFDTVLTENEPLMELFEEQLQNSLQLQ